MRTHRYCKSFNAVSMITTVVFAVPQLSGCADTPHADAAYGAAYRQMIQQQTVNPEAAINPPVQVLEEADAQRLSEALEVYRGDVGKGTAEVKRTLQFDVGK